MLFVHQRLCTAAAAAAARHSRGIVNSTDDEEALYVWFSGSLVQGGEGGDAWGARSCGGGKGEELFSHLSSAKTVHERALAQHAGIGRFSTKQAAENGVLCLLVKLSRQQESPRYTSAWDSLNVSVSFIYVVLYHYNCDVHKALVDYLSHLVVQQKQQAVTLN